VKNAHLNSASYLACPNEAKQEVWRLLEVDSPPSYGMVCRLVLIGERACYCVIYHWHIYVDDDCSACWQWIGVVPSL
jgi:hypothetical protein